MAPGEACSGLLASPAVVGRKQAVPGEACLDLLEHLAAPVVDKLGAAAQVACSAKLERLAGQEAGSLEALVACLAKWEHLAALGVAAPVACSVKLEHLVERVAGKLVAAPAEERSAMVYASQEQKCAVVSGGGLSRRWRSIQRTRALDGKLRTQSADVNPRDAVLRLVRCESVT